MPASAGPPPRPAPPDPSAMPSAHRRRPAARPLEAVGIGENEERAYRLLLSRPMATADELARALAMPLRRTQRLLDALEALGLATHSPERPRRYIPAAPDFALEALIRRRQEHLERVRLAIPEFREHAAAAQGAGDREQLVELVTDQAAARQIVRHMQGMPYEDLICLQRVPTVLTGLEPPSDLPAAPPQRHGRARSIADAEFIALPGALRRIRYDIACGEEVRLYPALPFKLVVIDRRIGLLPLNLRRPEGPWLIVRSSALLDALYEMFELLWARSTPIAFADDGTLRHDAGPEQVPASAGPLIPLLAAGLNDKTIAHQLGISAATLNRRLAALMRAFDARTRFQLGWRAALESAPAQEPARRPRRR